MAPARKRRKSQLEMDAAEAQILGEQRVVDYDVKEYVIDVINQLMDKNDIFIPEYQRQFIWPRVKRCRFIESLILGLPVPYLFTAVTDDGRFEVVDGTQRLMTIVEFLNDRLPLRNLEKLDELNSFRFSDLPVAQRRKLLSRSLRMIVLSEKADPSVRFDVFQRINSGSVILTPAEFRKGAFQGPFYKFVLECSDDPLFRKLCPVGKNKEKRGESAELTLRFFAYSEIYEKFTHDVANFLNKFVIEKELSFDMRPLEQNFIRTMQFADQHLPYGFRKSRTIRDTPRVRFEAISVGIHLALQQNPNMTNSNTEWLDSAEFKRHTTTHASNSGPRLRGRIEFVRDALLGAS
ncbi:MAG: DUF262 domain-containing protein [Proteobacteria bacterium]|nr:DUF262 domain-containing protein [Pseudomonadota bacterium]